MDCVELLGDMLQEEGLAQCTRNKQKPFAAIAQVILPFAHFAELASGLQDASFGTVSEAGTGVLHHLRKEMQSNGYIPRQGIIAKRCPA